MCLPDVDMFGCYLVSSDGCQIVGSTGGFPQPVQAKEDVCKYQYYLGKFHRDQPAE